MLTKASYITQRRASLRVLDRQIRGLQQFCDWETTGASSKYDEAIRGLQTTRDKAAVLLRVLNGTNDRDWVDEDATTDVEHAWTELRNAVLVAIASTYSESD